jgi:SAM-dependent methyltransferase
MQNSQRFLCGGEGNLNPENHDRIFHGDITRLRAPERLARLEVDRTVSLTLEDSAARTLLDVGTGSGVFAEAFASQSLTVTGIDVNETMLAAAKDFVPEGEFILGQAEALPFAAAVFDIIFYGNILHETNNLQTALNEAYRVVRHRVVILEWQYRQEAEGPPLSHRLKPEQIIAAARQAGFSKIESFPLQSMILFRLDKL